MLLASSEAAWMSIAVLPKNVWAPVNVTTAETSPRTTVDPI